MAAFLFGAPLLDQVLASSDWFVNHLHLSELWCFTCTASSQEFVSFDLQERALLRLGFLRSVVSRNEASYLTGKTKLSDFLDEL
jgi:hypothetical protein